MAELNEADQAAEVARLAKAAKQLLTAGRPEVDLCRVVLADEWSSQAPLCSEKATMFVCFDNYRTGVLTQGTFYPGESMTRLCAGHEEQVRRTVGWRWSTPLAEVTR